MPALASPAFLLGYVAIWYSFGIAALALDAGVHWAVDPVRWLATHAWVIETGARGGVGSEPTEADYLRHVVSGVERGFVETNGAMWSVAGRAA